MTWSFPSRPRVLPVVAGPRDWDASGHTGLSRPPDEVPTQVLAHRIGRSRATRLIPGMSRARIAVPGTNQGGPRRIDPPRTPRLLIGDRSIAGGVDDLA